MSVCRRARADFRVPILTVVLPATASELELREVEGATSWFSMEVMGSRRGREEVEGSCSCVAMIYGYDTFTATTFRGRRAGLRKVMRITASLLKSSREV